MELFGVIGWISVPQFIMQYIDLPAESLPELISNELLYWWITLGVAGTLYLSGLILGGLGLFKLAKRAGIPHAWLGFLPFANTYLAGQLAGETNIFGSKVKHIGLITMICEIVFVLFNIFAVVLQIVVLNPGYFKQVTSTAGVSGYVYTLSKDGLDAAGLGWIYTLMHYSILEIISYVFSLVMIFLFCTLFIAFFRKYYARSPFMMTFLCSVLPARGYVLFAVRNNSPVDYDALMRQRMQRQQQMYGGANGYPYGGYGPQTPPPPPPSSGPQEDPYGNEFGGSTPPGGSTPTGTPPDDDPFSDF